MGLVAFQHVVPLYSSLFSVIVLGHSKFALLDRKKFLYSCVSTILDFSLSQIMCHGIWLLILPIQAIGIFVTLKIGSVGCFILESLNLKIVKFLSYTCDKILLWINLVFTQPGNCLGTWKLQRSQISFNEIKSTIHSRKIAPPQKKKKKSENTVNVRKNSRFHRNIVSTNPQVNVNRFKCVIHANKRTWCVSQKSILCTKLNWQNQKCPSYTLQ